MNAALAILVTGATITLGLAIGYAVHRWIEYTSDPTRPHQGSKHGI